MPKFKATKKFKSLGTENSYHYMETEQFYALQRGETVEISLNGGNQYLINDKFIERIAETEPPAKSFNSGFGTKAAEINDQVFSQKHLNKIRKASTNKKVRGL